IRISSLAVPTLMLDPVGIFGGLGRAFRLTEHQFWRLLRLLLLVGLVGGVAGSMLRLPFSISGEVFLTSSDDTGHGLMVYLLLTAIGSVVSSGLLHPLSSARHAQ